MTLLNTITNLAGTWISTLALWLVDNVSFKDCEGVSDLTLDCDTMQELKVSFNTVFPPIGDHDCFANLTQACQAAGGHCVTHLDGYYAEMVVCILFGLFWYWWQRGKLKHLQSLPDSAWKAK